MVTQMVESVGDTLLISFIISILLNIFINIVAIVPSFFLTAFNVAVFGVIGGMIVSFIGEAIGCGVAFLLYKKGFRTFVEKRTNNVPFIKKILDVTGVQAFFLVFICRVLPFVPSGLVTLYGAIGKMSFVVFITASTIGKIPALIVETFSTYVAMNWIGNTIFFVTVVIIAVIFIIHGFKNKKTT
ncbi:MAG: TVP38/TMEM64 family protein [Bacillaceae bacterium]